jgi:D-amino peptidase
MMTDEVNAAVRGALEAGADEVLVTDGHAYGMNILAERLDPHAHLNSGNGSPLSMVQGVDQGVQGVCFIGYHARAGSTHAILDHTWSSTMVADVRLNGRGVGEIGLNAAVCGHFDVPVLMISGDQTACAEARDLLGAVDVAVVKRAAGRMSAECLPPDQARQKICEMAANAVYRLQSGTAPQPFKVPTPVTVTVAFNTSNMADRASLLPGAARLDGRTLEVTLDDMVAAYRAFRALTALARP